MRRGLDGRTRDVPRPRVGRLRGAARVCARFPPTRADGPGRRVQSSDDRVESTPRVNQGRDTCPDFRDRRVSPGRLSSGSMACVPTRRRPRSPFAAGQGPPCLEASHGKSRRSDSRSGPGIRPWRYGDRARSAPRVGRLERGGERAAGRRESATGRPLDAQFVHRWSLENGKVVAFQQYTDTAQWNRVYGAS
jgi:hypothetical protein